MRQWLVYYSGTSNRVTDYPIMAKSHKEAKMLAISIAQLNPLMIARLTAKHYT